MDVGADQQHVLRDTALDQRPHDLHAVGEAGALLAKIEGRDRRAAETLLDQGPATREVVVWRHRGAHQVVDLAGLEPGVGERGAAGFGTQLGRADPFVDVVARDDAAPFSHPFVAGLEHPRQHRVRDLVRRHGDAAAGQLSGGNGHGTSRSAPRGPRSASLVYLLTEL